ncbi:MAG: FxsA family protein [Halioglobus sp.]
MRFIVFLFPWLELFTLIQLGIETSALTALAYVFVTLFVGLALLQRQGRELFEHVREGQRSGVLGPQLLLDDMALGLAGLLLMVPGVITDIASLVVLFGPLRRRIARALYAAPPEPYAPERDTTGHQTIEGSYRRVDED